MKSKINLSDNYLFVTGSPCIFQAGLKLAIQPRLALSHVLPASVAGRSILIAFSDN
jgi:hypothetical protein